MFRNAMFVLPLFVLGLAAAAGAQPMSAVPVSTLEKAASTPVVTTDDQNAFYRDVENRLVFVDFQQLRVNLNDIVVRNAEGAVVHRDHVFNLPVDTIFEIDMADFPAGVYYIELHSFTGIIRKAVRIE